MREILFRGKRKDIPWEYGGFACHEDGACIIDPITEIETYVDEETVGQYTGLTDKNGTKIFEGDIVAFGEYIYPVEWQQDRCGFGYGSRADRMLEIDGKHCEVIGDVYDDEYLLKGGAEENDRVQNNPNHTQASKRICDSIS